MTSSTLLTIDHLLIAAPDLDAGCEYAATIFAEQPQPGGSHPGIGTRNALLGLEDDIYIEILAPDPQQDPDFALGRYLAGLIEPSLMWWAVRCNDIDKFRATLIANDIDVGEVESWSRVLRDGSTLSWKLLMTREAEPGPAMPFFIQWDDMDAHPAKSLAAIGKLTSMQISQPNESAALSVVEEFFDVDYGATSGINVEIDTRNSPVSLITPTEPPPAIGSIR
jgi:hypothetical protein